MASFVAETSQSQVPLSSQFNPSNFNMRSFDNFDHEEAILSGIGGSHDTVMILMQDKSTRDSNSKLSKSDTVWLTESSNLNNNSEELHKDC